VVHRPSGRKERGSIAVREDSFRELVVRGARHFASRRSKVERAASSFYSRRGGDKLLNLFTKMTIES